MDEKSALRSLRKGSQEALVWFMETYTPYVGAIIQRILGDRMCRQDAEEVASDVFLALWNQANRIRTENVKAYLGRMARNMALNKLRQAGLTLPLQEEVLVLEGTTPEEQVLQKEARTLVSREVDRMPEPEREILIRFYYYFEPIEQIAARLQMNPATVKTRLYRARKRLKAVLQEKLC